MLRLNKPWDRAVGSSLDLYACLVTAIASVVEYAFDGGKDRPLMQPQTWRYPNKDTSTSMFYHIAPADTESALRIKQLAALVRTTAFLLASTRWRASYFDIIMDRETIVAKGYFGPRHLFGSAGNTSTTESPWAKTS